MANIKTSLIRATQWITRMGALTLLGSIPDLRMSAGAGAHPIKVPKGLKWLPADASGVRCEWMTPLDAPADSVLLYLHGGGGVLGLYNSSRKMIGHIALACNLRTLIPDYRLAPEDPFPAGMNDCLAAYRWLLSEGFHPQKIVVAGDSMGGYLAICALLVLRDTNQPLPAAAVCISPNTDLACSGKSMQANANRDALLSPKFARTMACLYAGGHDLSDPLISPLVADVHGLPPFLIQAGAEEILLDDSKRFSEKALVAGVDLELEIWPRMWHDWHTCVPDLPEANQAIEKIARYVTLHV